MNRKILRLAVPNIISNITIPLVGMIDIAIAGHIGGDVYIGAIAIGAAIFNFVYWNFGFLRMGTSGFSAQAYGARDFSESMKVLVRSLTVAFSIALMLLLLQIPLGRFSLGLMDGAPEVMQFAADYFFIRIWAAPATLALYAMKGWFIGMQNSKTPMVIAIIINVVNLVFSLWFVYSFDMGLSGVAWGTVVAQYSGILSAFIFWIVYYKKLWRYVDFKNSLKIDALVKYFRVNGDIFIRTLCLVSVYTFFTSASSSMGTELLAVNTLLMQLFTLYSYMMDGFAYAGESLIGRYIGNKNVNMVRVCIRYLMLWGAVMGCLFMVIYGFGWRQILGLFTDSLGVLNIAGDYLIWVLAVPLVSFTAFLYDGILTGATHTKIMRNAIVVSMAVFFAIYYSLVGVMGNDALWVSFLSFLALRGFLQYLWSRKVFRV